MLHYLIVRHPRSYPVTCNFGLFVTGVTHKPETSKCNWAPFFCTSRAGVSSFPLGCFIQAQRLESRLLNFMSKYKDLYGSRNTPWILLRVCTRAKQGHDSMNIQSSSASVSRGRGLRYEPAISPHCSDVSIFQDGGQTEDTKL